jgi:peptidoglycan/LPS O-acetylase OafA/YrhL
MALYTRSVIQASAGSAPVARVYFENLNTIRFIAASLVIVHHIEQFKRVMHLPNYWDKSVIFIIGKLGVVLFFVLSGFLISYLLFKEQEMTQTISIKDFYIRRILRIWPLYFLIVFSALFFFPFIDFFTLEQYPRSVVWDNLFYKVALFVLLLPNAVLEVLGLIPYASQTWSIGAEEQFYLAWPALNKAVKNKWLLMFSVIIGYLVVKFGVKLLLPPSDGLSMFNELWKSVPIDCMAIGGLFAVILHEKSAFATAVKKLLFNQAFQWLVLAITVALILTGTSLSIFHYEGYAVLFGVLICNFAANKQRIFSMETRWTSYLGKISYGLYMFHPIAIVFSIRLLQRLNLLQDAILYPLAFALVILMSAVSYNFFEKRFINMKANYSRLVSGDSAKEESQPLKDKLTAVAGR